LCMHVYIAKADTMQSGDESSQTYARVVSHT